MFYLFRITHSQTDRSTIIVKAESHELAREYVDKNWSGCYVDQIGSNPVTMYEA